MIGKHTARIDGAEPPMTPKFRLPPPEVPPARPDNVDYRTMDKLGRLKRVDLREIWKSEAQHFTPWLAKEENLFVLAETLGMELELDAQEANVGPFRADLVCRNADGGSLVLIENQLERTDHGHLGQLLTYAAGLQAATICWIAESFTEEHRAALDWLNKITSDRFQFLGLEVEVWKIGESSPAPKFNIVSRPNDWSRSVADSKEMTPKRLRLQEFWAALMEQLEKRGSGVRRKKPQPENWMNFSVGRAEFWLETTLQSAEKWIGVALFMSGPDATAHWALLERQRAEIERELGVLEWRALPDRKSSSIRLRLKDTNPLQEKEWPTQLDWMASTLERFDKTFRPRVKSLDASEWRPDGDVT